MKLVIHEPSGPRLDLAIERLKEGFPFEYLGTNFNLSNSRLGRELTVHVYSSKATGEVTKASAWADLERGSIALADLLANAAFYEAVANARVNKLLIYDYGTGSVELARIVGEEIKWAKGVEPLDS